MRLKIALNSLIFALIGALMLFQLNLVSAFAQEGSNPISSPITQPPAPITSPITNPTPTPAPITSPITNPTPTPSATPSPASSSINSSFPAVSVYTPPSTTEAPSCGDSKPKSAPKLISAVSGQPNQVNLVWSKAEDPVTYYLLAYGLKAGTLQFGNPNVGDKNTTSYIVKGLSGGTTYYFKVRAGNNCAPGDYSNEIAVKVGGSKISTIKASGFETGVLAATASGKLQPSPSQQEVKFQPITSYQPSRATSTISTVWEAITNLFSKLFRK